VQQRSGRGGGARGRKGGCWGAGGPPCSIAPGGRAPGGRAAPGTPAFRLPGASSMGGRADRPPRRRALGANRRGVSAPGVSVCWAHLHGHHPLRAVASIHANLLARAQAQGGHAAGQGSDLLVDSLIGVPHVRARHTVHHRSVAQAGRGRKALGAGLPQLQERGGLGHGEAVLRGGAAVDGARRRPVTAGGPRGPAFRERAGGRHDRGPVNTSALATGCGHKCWCGGTRTTWWGVAASVAWGLPLGPGWQLPPDPPPPGARKPPTRQGLVLEQSGSSKGVRGGQAGVGHSISCQVYFVPAAAPHCPAGTSPARHPPDTLSLRALANSPAHYRLLVFFLPGHG